MQVVVSIVIIWAIAWIIFGIGLGNVFAYPQEYPEMPTNYEIMCSITTKEPFYDCEQQWILIYQEQITIMDPLGQWVLGYAVHEQFIAHYDMSICNFYEGFRELGIQYCYMEWMGVGSHEDDLCYSGRCLTPLQHEIKHLQCDCDWHKDSWPSKRMVIEITGYV